MSYAKPNHRKGCPSPDANSRLATSVRRCAEGRLRVRRYHSRHCETIPASVNFWRRHRRTVNWGKELRDIAFNRADDIMIVGTSGSNGS